MFVQSISLGAKKTTLRRIEDVDDLLGTLIEQPPGSVLFFYGDDEEDWMGIEYHPNCGYYVSSMRSNELSEFLLVDRAQPFGTFVHHMMGAVARQIFVREPLALEAARTFALTGGRTPAGEWMTIRDIQKDLRTRVDLSLIDEMLRLSPHERLLLNDQLVDTILALRQSFRGLQDGEP